MEEVGDAVRRVLPGWDVREVSGGAAHSLTEVLRGVFSRSPSFMSWLTEEPWLDAAPGTKAVIAKAVAVHERVVPGHHALDLARRADCPPDLAHRIHDWLRGR